jgi:hypothetical protein
MPVPFSASGDRSRHDVAMGTHAGQLCRTNGPTARWRRALLVAALVPAIVFAGCGSDDDDEDDAPPTEPTTSVLPPVFVDVDSLQGTTVEVRAGGAVVVTGDDETFTAWTATIADPTVVAFVPGRDDGSATFNPGFEALAVGSTDVTMANGESGATIGFRIDVTPDG